MSYNIRALPAIGGTNPIANAVNNYGQVAGYSDDNLGVFYAVRWTGTTPLKLDMPPGCVEAVGLAINSSGVVVGYGYTGTVDVAVRWDGNVATVLTPPVGTSTSQATGINDNGIICGSITTTLGKNLAVRWDDAATPVILDTDPAKPGDGTAANGINSSNQICGYAVDGVGVIHPAKWTGTALTELDLLVGGNLGIVTGINDSGVCVGYANHLDGTTWPVRWTGTVATQLEVITPGNEAPIGSIASSGDAVGNLPASYLVASDRAVLWASTGTSFVQLGQLADSTAAQARGIGPNGIYITGNCDSAGLGYAVIWGPLQPNDIVSTVATIDHDLLIGVEANQHHAEVHALQSHVTDAVIYKAGPSPIITDADVVAVGMVAADGQIAATYNTLLGQSLLWTRVAGTWDPLEVT